MPRRVKSDPIDHIELERRAKISKSLKSSPKQKAYHAGLKGVPKGPDSLETRAAKAASHLAVRGTQEWDIHFHASLVSLQVQQAAQEQLAELSGARD